jgi:hypothetical protein
LAIAIANVDPQDIGNVGATGCVSLHVYPPGAPIKVEIIHVDAAERGLQRGKYVAYIKAERLRLGSVNVWPRERLPQEVRSPLA